MLRVLLVCTGNICRSPLAHGFLVHHTARLPGVRVRSAGTWARDGSEATPEGVAAAAELGIDISSHLSTRYTPELSGWADVVITMTAEQRDEVTEADPEAAVKTFTLKELVSLLDSLPTPHPPSREGLLRRIAEAHGARSEGRAPQPADQDVADPLGMSPLTYRMVAQEIDGLIDRLVDGLAGAFRPAAVREG